MVDFHIISFKIVCNSCNRKPPLNHSISCEGYDDILCADSLGYFNINPIKNLLKDFYDRKEISCEFCGEVGNFEFYDLEVDRHKLYFDSTRPLRNHRQPLLGGKRLVIKFKKIIFLIEDLKGPSSSPNRVSFDNSYGGGLLEIDKSTVKVFDTVRNLMRELFQGTINKMEYSDSGKVLLIEGTTLSNWDSSPVTFKINFGVQQIGDKSISNSDNYYLDIEPSEASVKNKGYKSNYLLYDEESFFVPD